jgi:hypothetical protein
VAGAVRKKRPCSICRRWFLPDARVVSRQHACDRDECQRERHRRADQRWRAANRDYDRDRRWRVSIAAAKEDPSAAPPAANAPPPTSGLPWDVVQDEMGVEGRVIIAGVVREMGLFVQDEMRKEVSKIVDGIVRHPRWAAQDEIDPGG